MNKIKKFIKGLKKGQKEFGETIATVVNSILLSVVYLLGVGLTFIFSRLFDKHFLDSKIDLNKKTYWSNLNLNKKPLGELSSILKWSLSSTVAAGIQPSSKLDITVIINKKAYNLFLSDLFKNKIAIFYCLRTTKLDEYYVSLKLKKSLINCVG